MAAVLAAFQSLRYLLVAKRFRPKWMRQFVDEEPVKEDDIGQKSDKIVWIWSFLLAALSLLAAASQVAKLIRLSNLRLPSSLLLAAWILNGLVVSLLRPRYCPTHLVPFYILALVPEAAGIGLAPELPTLHEGLHSFALLATLLSLLVLLLMRFRPRSPGSGPIGGVGRTPQQSERSPEDALRLWQFITVAWIGPILSLGKKRKLEKEDVWSLPYEFETARLARAFRELQGSVLRRLLRANRVDICVLILTAFIRLFCDLAASLFLHELLLVMESPNRITRVAIIYAILLWVLRIIGAQNSMLSLWYARRSYERSRGELIMMMYEKAMSRKVIVGLESKDESSKGSDSAVNGTPSTANGCNGTTTEANGSASQHRDTKKPSDGDGKSKKSQPPTTSMWQLIKSIFTGGKAEESKQKGPASTGQVLNLIRTDAYDIAQRFMEIEILIKIPFGIVFSTYLIWKLLGPSCLLAVLVVAISYGTNMFLARVQVKWRRYGKKATDARIQSNSQFLESLRYLRWYGWHETWLAKVMAARQHELNLRIVSMVINLMMYFLSVLSGYTFPVIAFFAYTALAGHELRIDLIFPALTLFNTLQERLRQIPMLITNLLNAWVALERIEDFMKEPERETDDRPTGTVNDGSRVCSITMERCSFAWPGKSEPTLREVSLTVGPGLTMVYGKIGSGKTALLLGMLHEMDLLSGQCEVPNEGIAYCAQTPWLQSMSIRDNIIFHAPYDEERYQQVLDSCALLPDFAEFKDRDKTEIGENGIGLSGGQRARVALARAVYSRSRFLLLDDPLSALDHQTAESIVQKCFAGPLMRDRTMVLATHRVSLVHSHASKYVEVANGHVTVSEDDPFEADHAAATALDTQAEEKPAESQPKDAKASTEPGAKLVEEEHREEGGIKAKVWIAFLKAAKYWWVGLGVMMILTQVFRVMTNWFYKAWGEAYGEEAMASSFYVSSWSDPGEEWTAVRELQTIRSVSLFNPSDYFPPPQESLRPWLLALLLFNVISTLSLLGYAISQLTAVYATSKNMFAAAMQRITYASFRFFDTTPSGRLMNRLTSDISVMDGALTYFGHTIFFAVLWASSVIVVASVSPLFLVLIAVLMGVFVAVFLHFLPTSRHLKRLETVSLSPLFTRFGELLQSQGLTTVRAFHMQHEFEESTTAMVNLVQTYTHFYWSVQNWLMYRYENISAAATFGLTVVALLIDLSPGLTAFMLINANMLINATHTLCLRFGDLQTEFISVERVVELLEVDQEPQGTYSPPAAWPRFGAEVVFDHVTIRYAENLDPALLDLSLRIPGGRITAVIGRTGSGKSTLASALLNIVRAETGSIKIDGVSLTDIDVNALRHRVTFIPQEPVLFDGTIHENLDPVDEYDASNCAAVLSRVAVSAGQEWSLADRVEAGGRNFSQGQRQLLGLTRAVLRRSSVIILDEATASIDVETSMKLQQIIREELNEATVITIAHRVEAVRGADYVIELEAGRVKRQGKVEDIV